MQQDKTILFAEPIEANPREFYSNFENRGYKIIMVKSLKETLLTIQNERVDLLVLDAALLEEDCGFISVIKGMEKDLPIIICSTTNTPELESKIRKQRIFYYHIRSFGAQDLEMAISNAVNGLPK